VGTARTPGNCRNRAERSLACSRRQPRPPQAAQGLRSSVIIRHR